MGGRFFFSSRRRHTRLTCDWSSDVCSSDLPASRRDLVAATRGGGGRVAGCRPSAYREGEGAGASRGGRAGGARRPAGRVRSEERRVGKEGRSRGAPDLSEKEIMARCGRQSG